MMKRLPLAALPVLLLAGCAQPPPPPPQAGPPPAWQGRIVAMRPAPNGALVEFIARDETGRTISVVQPNTAGLALGSRVSLVQTGRTHLALAP